MLNSCLKLVGETLYVISDAIPLLFKKRFAHCASALSVDLTKQNVNTADAGYEASTIGTFGIKVSSRFLLF